MQCAQAFAFFSVYEKDAANNFKVVSFQCNEL